MFKKLKLLNKYTIERLWRGWQYALWAWVFGPGCSFRLNRLDLLAGAAIGKKCWCGKTYWRIWWHQEC